MADRNLPPFVTWLFLGVIVYVAYAHTGFFPTHESMILPYAWSADAAAAGEYEKLIVSVFAHGGIVHLLVNAIALASFGPVVERALGPVRFAALFLAAGVAGNVAHATFQSGPVVGASGAIFGLLGVVLILAPLAAVSVMFVLPMPILLVSALYVAFVPVLMEFQDALPIAHAAHLGGFVLGLAAGAVLTPRRALRLLPGALLVFAATWFAVGYGLTIPIHAVLDADARGLFQLLWPIGLAVLAIIVALADLGRVEAASRAGAVD